MSDDYEHTTHAQRRAQADSEDLAAIRFRADRAWVSLHEINQAKADCRALLDRLDALKAERDAIARDAESTVTALNATIQRLAEQRDSAYALLSSVCAYLERLPSRTPEREQLITAIHMQLGPRSSRIDELP